MDFTMKIFAAGMSIAGLERFSKHRDAGWHFG
jgi:hypothetical protein